MNRRKLIGVVASLLIAAIGTFALLNYVNTATSKAATTAPTEPTVGVLVVKALIPKGTPAENLGAAVAVEQLPVSQRNALALSGLGDIAGLVATADLLPGEQVLQGRFVTAEQAAAATLPAGMVGVWVPIESNKALAGRVKPGDQVAVFASFAGLPAANNDPTASVPTTHLMLHKVPVIDVMGATAMSAPTPGAPATTAPAPAAGTNVLVMLGVAPGDAERLVFASNNGTLSLALEPSNVREAGTKVVERGNVYYDNGQRPAAVAATPTTLAAPVAAAPAPATIAPAAVAPTTKAAAPVATVARSTAAPATVAPAPIAPTTTKGRSGGLSLGTPTTQKAG